MFANHSRSGVILWPYPFSLRRVPVCVVAAWLERQLMFHANTGIPVWPVAISRIVELLIADAKYSKMLEAGPPDPSLYRVCRIGFFKPVWLVSALAWPVSSSGKITALEPLHPTSSGGKSAVMAGRVAVACRLSIATSGALLVVPIAVRLSWLPRMATGGLGAEAYKYANATTNAQNRLISRRI